MAQAFKPSKKWAQNIRIQIVSIGEEKKMQNAMRDVQKNFLYSQFMQSK